MLQNVGSRVHKQGMWNLAGPGNEPASPALVSGFLATGPPGKSLVHIFKRSLCFLLENGLQRARENKEISWEDSSGRRQQ